MAKPENLNFIFKEKQMICTGKAAKKKSEIFDLSMDGINTWWKNTNEYKIRSMSPPQLERSLRQAAYNRIKTEYGTLGFTLLMLLIAPVVSWIVQRILDYLYDRYFTD